MNRYNKKAVKNQREKYLRSQSRTKKEMNYFDYLLFFEEEYSLINNECRKNLKQISKSLCEITIAKGDN